MGAVENTTGSGGGSGSGGSGSGGSSTGSGGASGTPCTTSDARMVPASQRIVLLTSSELVNTIRYLVDDKEATAIKTSGKFNVTSDSDRTFPPADGEPVKSITDVPTLTPIKNMAEAVAQYVFDNFASLTKCTTVTDACAQTYLTGMATRAYRRALTSAETTRFTTLYDTLRSQMVNGYAVTMTVQAATQHAVYALLMSPQLLWRWEIGNTAMASTSPPGFNLTEDELASQVSFFLTDNPPDDMLLAAAKAGSLRSNLSKQVDRILATQASKDWMTTIMETYYLLNQLPKVTGTIDGNKFPILSSGLINDMRTDARMFLDNVLWSGSLNDLLLSRTAYVNTHLATDIYKLNPVPSGATETAFVKVTLPSDQRSGILSNPGFITRSARPDRGSVVARGLAIRATMLCTVTPGPPDAINQPGGAVDVARGKIETQTVQEQVASRSSVPLCAGCHANFDSYGLVQDYYDNLGVYRTKDDLGKDVDAQTKLPALVGGQTVKSTVELAQVMSQSAAFTNCMATAVLQYALVDSTAPVQLPINASSGCAAADVAQRFQATSSKSFTDLLRATASAPAFALRAADTSAYP